MREQHSQPMLAMVWAVTMLFTYFRRMWMLGRQCASIAQGSAWRHRHREGAGQLHMGSTTREGGKVWGRCAGVRNGHGDGTSVGTVARIGHAVQRDESDVGGDGRVAELFCNVRCSHPPRQFLVLQQSISVTATELFRNVQQTESWIRGLLQ